MTVYYYLGDRYPAIDEVSEAVDNEINDYEILINTLKATYTDRDIWNMLTPQAKDDLFLEAFEQEWEKNVFEEEEEEE